MAAQRPSERRRLSGRETPPAGEVWILPLAFRAAASRCRGDAPGLTARRRGSHRPLGGPERGRLGAAGFQGGGAGGRSVGRSPEEARKAGFGQELGRTRSE